MSARTLTLEQYLSDNKNTIVETGPVYYVHPRNRNKPLDEQRRTLVEGVAEVLLESGVSLYVCQQDNIVFDTVDAVVIHLRMAGSHKTGKATFTDDADIAASRKAKSRRKTQSLRRTDLSEPSYSELKKKLDEAYTKIGEQDVTIRKQHVRIEELVVQVDEARLLNGDADHSKCYESVGQRKDKVTVVRDSANKLYVAMPL